MKFEKWTALGNDYLIIEAAALPWELTPERVKRICDRPFGVGSDGILLLIPIEDPAYVAELRIFNPDGSEAELSGNGARQAALYLRHRGWTDADEFAILTKAGEVKPTIRTERDCTMDLGRARTSSPDFPSGGEDGIGELEAGGRTWRFQHVSIGNPQCAIAVSERERRSWTCRRSDRRSNTTSSSRTAPTSASSRSGDRWSAPGSSNAAWGRPCLRGPAPAERLWPPS